MDFQPNAITDFLKIEIPVSKRSELALENLLKTGSGFGNEYFQLENEFEPIKAKFNEARGKFTLEGSMPFFWQGHNFSFSNAILLDAIDYVSEILCLDLMQAEVKTFEFGIVAEINLPASYLLKSHFKLNGYSLNSWQTKKGELTGIEFKGPTNRLKMYDVEYRFKQLKIQKSFLSKITGFDLERNYLRIENHVFKPDRYLQVRALSLKEYCSDSMQDRLKIELMETYQAIEKKSSLVLEGIEKPTVNQLLYLVLAENIPDFSQTLKAKIKALNLDADTTKNRKKQIAKDLMKLDFSPDPRIDLLPEIQKSLSSNSENTEKKCQIIKT